MEKMLIVIVDNETKAYDVSQALNKLDEAGDISVHVQSVVEKKADGKVELKKVRGDFPINTVAGTAIGSLIGLLGGPIGLLIGAVGGTAVGGTYDLHRSGVDAGFVEEASAKLTPGKFAVIADVSEEWQTPLDTEMEKLGATVLRAPKRDVEAEQRKQDMKAVKAEIKQLKSEASRAKDESKAKLQSKVDGLEKKLQNQQTQAKQRLEEMKKEEEAKVKALEKKAANARGEAKAALNERAKQIRESYKKTKEKLEKLTAKKSDEEE